MTNGWESVALRGERGPGGGSAGRQGEQGPAGPIGPPGRGLRYRGAWSANTAYSVGDMVSHNGQTYVASASVGPTATTPNLDTAKWSALAIHGAQGEPGQAGIEWENTWSPTVQYEAGDAVQYNGSSYITNASSLGDPPPELPAYVVTSRQVTHDSSNVGDRIDNHYNRIVDIEAPGWVTSARIADGTIQKSDLAFEVADIGGFPDKDGNPDGVITWRQLKTTITSAAAPGQNFIWVETPFTYGLEITIGEGTPNSERARVGFVPPQGTGGNGPNNSPFKMFLTKPLALAHDVGDIVHLDDVNLYRQQLTAIDEPFPGTYNYYGEIHGLVTDRYFVAKGGLAAYNNLVVFTGDTAIPAYITLGRNVNVEELTLGVAAAPTNFFTDAVVGDCVIRTFNVGQRLLLGTGSGPGRVADVVMDGTTFKVRNIVDFSPGVTPSGVEETPSGYLEVKIEGVRAWLPYYIQPFSDNFNRTYGSQLGPPWFKEVDSGNIVIINNRAAINSVPTTGFRLTCYYVTNTKNIDMSVDVWVPGGTAVSFIRFHHVNLTNGLVVQLDRATSTISVLEQNNNVYTLIGAPVPTLIDAIGGPTPVRIISKNGTIKVYANGLDLINATMTPAQITRYGSSGKHGFFANQSSIGTTYDNLVMNPAT